MPITQRGSSWQAQVNHKSDRYRRNFDTQLEAKQWEADSKARLLRGEAPDMGAAAKRQEGVPHTLAELANHVYLTHWAPMASGVKQLANALDIIGHIGPSVAFAKISSFEIDKARGALLAGGNSTSTVNRKVAALSLMLTKAQDAGLIDRKPKLAKYKVSEGRIRRVTPAEIDAVCAFFLHIGQTDMVDYVLLSLDTGARQGEVLQLRFQDCDDRKLTIWGTEAKSGKSRSVPLTVRAKEIITRRRTATNAATLFPDLNRWSVAHYWDRVREAMNLKDDKHFVPHALRHEFCSRLADRGLNAAVIKELAGHSTLAITQRYIHIGAQALVDAISALDKEPVPAPDLSDIPPEVVAKLVARGLLKDARVD